MAVLMRHGAQQSEIGGRESVRLAKLAHGDILRGPFANAADGAQPFDRLIEVPRRLEEMRIGQGRSGHGRQRGSAGARHSKRRQIRPCQ